MWKSKAKVNSGDIRNTNCKVLSDVKNVSKALGSATVMCALAACGGSSGDLVSSQFVSSGSATDISPGGSLVSEDASQVSSVSLSGEANLSATSELIIQNARISSDNLAPSSVEFQFEIADSGGAGINVEDLSVALEIATSGNFDDSYRQPLFDIRQSGATTVTGGVPLTARGAAADMPGGNYSARLVVNPNWQNAFDIVPADRDQSQPFHFIEERDYSNNASNTFAMAIQSTMSCVEDEFEENDSIATATVLPVGGQIAASLCTDTVDFYSIELAVGETTSIYFDYIGAQDNISQVSKYVLLDSQYKTVGGSVARESNDIKVNATVAGTYYLVVYGTRSSYQLTREPSLGVTFPENFSNDFANNAFFTGETAAGPQSWQLGDITLNKLAFTESGLAGQVVNCGRITTQFSADLPVAYVTPDHFADNYQFHFLAGGAYIVDGEQVSGWGVQNGDVFNAHWYGHDYPGYAQITGTHDWRYWSADGLSYVDCAIEKN